MSPRLSRPILGFLMAGSLAARVNAADVSVTLKDARGAPVADAVVTLSISGAKTPARYGQPLRVAQHKLRFEPFVLVAPVGAEVSFPNEDAVRHQVYSFSPTKKFELKLFGQDQSRSIRFDKTGVVALGCNIHDAMVAFIKVTDAPFAAVTDAAGRVVLHGVPAGAAKVQVWQPYLKAPNNTLSADVAVPDRGSVERAFSGVVQPPRGMGPM